MNFDLADLRAFLAVADVGNFTEAADSLHLSPSALSRRVNKLESALGTQLFERTTRKVVLSTSGRGFVPRARTVIYELENALIGFNGGTQHLIGEITIACVPSAVAYFLPKVIKCYREKYPHIRIRLLDESSSAILTSVAHGDADFGLTYIGTQDADIIFHPLLEEPFVVALPHGHPLAQRETVSWRDLANNNYISLAQGSGNRFLIDQALARLNDRPRWFCEVNHVPALVSLVAAGLGVGVVPRLAMPDGEDPKLETRPLVEPTVTRTIGIISRRGRQLPPMVQFMFDLLISLGKI